MLHNYFRLLKLSGSTFTDYSLANQELSASIVPALLSTDYLYIGQYFPFNNFFYYGNIANANDSDLTIQYWTGKEWRSAVDILDGTKVGNKTFARPGVIQFSPYKTQGWQKINYTSDSNSPTEMQTLEIYNLYWIRIKVSADLSALTSFYEMSYAFTSTDQLNTKDVEIGQYYASFVNGKTDWIREIVTSSKDVVNYLKGLDLIVHPGNILRFDDVSLATTFKTLSLIYQNLGPAYEKRMLKADADCKAALNIKNFTFDLNDNGQVDEKEIATTNKRIVR